MPYAQINDIQIYYERMGSGQPLLFLHGLGSSTVDWQAQTDFFQSHYACITVDMRGHGRSDKPPGPYSIKQFAADVCELLAVLGLESVHVIGLSMGGMIAFQMAVDAPSVLRSMTIINSGPEVPNRSLKDKANTLQRLILFRLLDMRKIGEIIGGRLFPDDHQTELRAGFIEQWAANDKTAYMNATRALPGWSVRDHISGIDIPTLVIAADEDYTPVEMKQAYVNEMPRAELAVITQARHAVNAAQPEKVNPVIADFLERVERNAL